jgi:predicted GH43/DUF377 family glycosyl hydrolase
MPFLQENDGSGGAGDAIADRMGAIGLRAGPIMTDISFENGVGPLEILPIMLEPDPARTVIRPFDFAYPPSFASERGIRSRVVAERILRLPEEDVLRISAMMMSTMQTRHRNVEAVLMRRYEELDEDVRGLEANHQQKLMLGAYFSQEFAFESAALFNPSIVHLPIDSNDGNTSFVLSLRGIGEGHISSVTFRTGLWRADGQVSVDPPSPFGVPPRILRGTAGGGARLVCEDSVDVSETVIFPVLPSQRQGVEDLRLVRFMEDDGKYKMIGTYTAFDGRNGRQEILEGIDFRTVDMHPLVGRMAEYKGMALFPRRIGGRYVMLGRQDNENIWLLESDDLYRWDEGRPIMRPEFFWEFVQLGNCGSPIEIDEGWLVFTHGVAMVRAYSIGACLLDKDDPSIVVARTTRPILVPSFTEPGGYVPNVVYSCGALVRNRDILLPYAVGDRCTGFATGTVDAVLATMM